MSWARDGASTTWDDSVAWRDMITIERSSPDTFTLVSDNTRAENALLAKAVERAAPHWLPEFNRCPVGGDGQLRFPVDRAEWRCIAEVLDEMEGDVNQFELDAIEAEVDRALLG